MVDRHHGDGGDVHGSAGHQRGERYSAHAHRRGILCRREWTKVRGYWRRRRQLNSGKPVGAIVNSTVCDGDVYGVLDTSVAGNDILAAHRREFIGGYRRGTWVLTSYLVSNAIVLPLTGVRFSALVRSQEVFYRLRDYFDLELTAVRAGAVAADAGPVSRDSGRGRQRNAAGVAGDLGRQLSARKAGHGHWRFTAWAWCWWPTPTIGPTLGGWITDTYSWRWIFLLNVPIGVISLLLISAADP